MENQPPDNEVKILQSDFLFDMDEMMFPEQIDDKFLPVFDSEIMKLESNMLDEIKRDLNPEPEEPIPPVQAPKPALAPAPMPPPPAPVPPKNVLLQIPDKTKACEEKGNKAPIRQSARKKTKKSLNLNDVNVYVNKMLREDIKASLKSLEKKYKKEKPEEKFTGLCEQCGLTFSTSHEYKKHIRSHEDKGELCQLEYIDCFSQLFINFSSPFSQIDVQVPLQILFKGIQSSANVQYSCEFTHTRTDFHL